MLKDKNSKVRRDIRVFGNARVMCSAAILCALAVAIAALCKFLTFGSIRITFENLPIVFSGYLFGPWVGLICGLVSDIISTAVSQYGISGINPIITLGAGAVGLCAGIASRLLDSRKRGLRLACSVAAAHLFGNVIIKSVGLMVYYSYPLLAILPRIPLYIAIGLLEFCILMVLCQSKALRRVTGGLGYEL